MRVLPSERSLSTAPEGAPLPDGTSETSVISRTEVVAFALVGLLIICVVAALYLAKAFFLPVVMAFVVGTMLSPAASLLGRYRIPRAVAAVASVVRHLEPDEDHVAAALSGHASSLRRRRASCR